MHTAIPISDLIIENGTLLGASSHGRFLTVPEGVHTVVCSAFADDPELTYLQLPHSLHTIERDAFSRCTSLRRIGFSKCALSIGYSAFEGCTSLCELDIPDNTLKIGSRAFMGCTSLARVSLPKNLTLIDSEAFRGCLSLGELEFRGHVTHILPEAFAGCTSLCKVALPRRLRILGDGAFACCGSLESIVTDPDNRDYIAVGNCLIYMPDGELVAGCNNSIIPQDGTVRSIAAQSFHGLSGLKHIEIPESVTSIDPDAFRGCRALATAKVPLRLRGQFEKNFAPDELPVYVD